MNQRIIHNLLVLLVFCLATSTYAQQEPSRNWDLEKIKGVRQLPYAYYTGYPYLTDTWVPGKIELEDGVIVDSLHLRYSSYKDELVYYNKEAAAQITIDKSSLKGFSFVDPEGNNHVFRKLYYDNFGKGDRYFEVLSDGEIDLLAYRKVSLDASSPYKDETGIMKNMVYSRNYSYYFYSPEKGYNSVRMNKIALLSKFDKISQKAIRKLLRKNRIHIYNEENFIQAWKIIEKEGFKIIF